MRELVYTGFMSLDGVADSPGGTVEGHRSGGWVIDTEFVPEAYRAQGGGADRDDGADVRPSQLRGVRAPSGRGSEDHAAYKELPKFVVSSSLTEDALVEGWGPTTILRSTEDVAALKQGDGGAIFIHGSPELARSLSDADLIDRYNLLVFPVLLGAGKSLFSRADRDKLKLELREGATYSNGVAKLIYDVKR